MDTIEELARQVCEQEAEEPAYVAQVDQERSKWKETFTAKGLDLKDPGIAAACFLATQILLADLVFISEDSDEPLATFGDLLVSVSVAMAEVVNSVAGLVL